MMDSREKKDDDDAYYVPFAGLEKGLVLQEKRIFNETPLNPRKCCHLITKILYLLTQGDSLTTAEATDVFFAVTKLFQSKDIVLRRMTYLVLKELTPLAESVIMVISILSKDINSNVDLYRANAIRALCKISDVQMLGPAERYIKQAIVDKEAYVASAALVSGVHLMQLQQNHEVVKRWLNEIQDAVKSKSTMVQYHGLCLLYEIRKHDRLAVAKFISTMIRAPIRSVYAHCFLIRIVKQVLEEDPTMAERGFYDYLDSCLRHKSEIVVFEAARSICDLKNIAPRELADAVNVLQIFLSNPKAAMRFAAVRVLNKVAQVHPNAIFNCNLDMENLINDSNRSIATLAITTLLKTGSEASIDRLMKQIAHFMGEISDEFKVVVVEAIQALCFKFPQKHRSLLNFLSHNLRDEGGYEFKRAIVDAMLTIITEIPETKELGLSHLCEFIEDCEYTLLSTKILAVIGRDGPSTSNPSKYIRYIYNRVILENANIRAAAVSALAKFGVKLEHLRPKIVVLLRRCLFDNDDDVRDRAAFYLRLLEDDYDLAKDMITTGLPVPLVNLEKALQEYSQYQSEVPFDINQVSTIDESKQAEAAKAATVAAAAATTGGAAAAAARADVQQSLYVETLSQVPEFAALGPLFRSSRPVELTEPETEYSVNVVKHVFAEHVVLQYNMTNTLNDQLLRDVMVRTDVSGTPELSIETILPAPALEFNKPGICYVLVRREGLSTGSVGNLMKFKVHDVDTSNGEVGEVGYDDEYQLEDMPLTMVDYTQKTFVQNFSEQWDELGDESEVVETFVLNTAKSLQDAVKDILDNLGMQPCDRTDAVPPKKAKHILYCGGKIVGGHAALVRCRMKADTASIAVELCARSKNLEVSTAIANVFV